MATHLKNDLQTNKREIPSFKDIFKMVRFRLKYVFLALKHLLKEYFL